MYKYGLYGFVFWGIFTFGDRQEYGVNNDVYFDFVLRVIVVEDN